MLFASGIVLTGLRCAGGAQPQDDAGKDLIFRTTEPRNAEPAVDKLIQSWMTPTKHFYVRSHAPNPVIDPAKFKLQVEGMVDKPMSLSLSDLAALPQHEITATLTCAGNRRAEFNAEGKVGGVQWGAGAIGNATWGGACLADVLRAAGVREGARHVWFEGLDEIEKGGTVIPFGASIPVEKAMIAPGTGDGTDQQEVGTLLATHMNGAVLLPDHGYPLRTIVPGYIGARSVKWLGKIVVSDKTSPNHYLATAYKLVRDTQSIDWQEAGPIYRYLINAAIGNIDESAELSAGPVEVAGYVLPSGIYGAKVRAVMVSADSGKSWTKAELTGEDRDYCWQLWKATVKVPGDAKELIVRAMDNEGGFMPPRVPWNAKGYLQNSWYRLPIRVKS